MSQLYELHVTAVGEVRDADGNLISTQPIDTTITVTADQLAALTEENTP